MERTYADKKNRFIETFNTDTGYYTRTGIIDKEGKDTDVDPFMRNYPQLIDIGIVGSCEHGKSGLCAAAGVGCYQSGLTKQMVDMSLEDYKSIITQSKDKVFQVALGGRGDPNKHIKFRDILKFTRENGIVPNYTTSGYGLTNEEVEATRKHVGAVAVSWYRNLWTDRAIRMFLTAGVKTNIHFVLGNNTIDEAIERVKNDSFPKGINAVIFLLHKPVGQGSQENVLQTNDPKVKEFFTAVDQFSTSFKIGFDSCSIPGILNFTKNIDRMSVEPCEASRYSTYVSSDMKMLPCSFDQSHRWAVDLKHYTIEEAWNSKSFKDFQNSMKKSCPGCSDRSDCYGGCPIINSITLCDRKEKNLTSHVSFEEDDLFLTRGWEKHGFGG